jgi:hypothetical protein
MLALAVALSLSSSCRCRRYGMLFADSMTVQIRPGAGIFKQFVGARNRVGIGLSYRPARLHRLAEFIP